MCEYCDCHSDCSSESEYMCPSGYRTLTEEYVYLDERGCWDSDYSGEITDEEEYGICNCCHDLDPTSCRSNTEMMTSRVDTSSCRSNIELTSRLDATSGMANTELMSSRANLSTCRCCDDKVDTANKMMLVNNGSTRQSDTIRGALINNSTRNTTSVISSENKPKETGYSLGAKVQFAPSITQTNNKNRANKFCGRTFGTTRCHRYHNVIIPLPYSKGDVEVIAKMGGPRPGTVGQGQETQSGQKIQETRTSKLKLAIERTKITVGKRSGNETQKTYGRPNGTL